MPLPWFDSPPASARPAANLPDVLTHQQFPYKPDCNAAALELLAIHFEMPSPAPPVAVAPSCAGPASGCTRARPGASPRPTGGLGRARTRRRTPLALQWPFLAARRQAAPAVWEGPR